MGRKKIENELKKQQLSITVSDETYREFKKEKIKNKSKLVNELLVEFFEIGNDVDNKVEGEADNG